MNRRQYLRRLAVGGSVPLAGCSGGESDSGEPETRVVTRTVVVERTVIRTPEPTATPTPFPNQLKAGEPFEMENGLRIIVDGIEPSPDNGGVGTSLGDVLLYVTVRNESDERQTGPEFWDFALLTENEQYGDKTGYASYHGNTEELLPGREGSGWIEFDTPSNVGLSDFIAVALLHRDYTVIWEL